MTDKNLICGVMVAYNPTEEVGANLQAMVRECGRVLVVDNGSTPEVLERMSLIPGVQILALGKNFGVAKALNCGAVWARERNYQWMVTFDQDSKPEPGMVAALWATHLRHPEAAVVGPCIREVGARGPEYRWVRRHPKWPWFFQRVECHEVDLPEVTMMITSGSMVELAVWADLGGFAEELFIDYVDIDYCLKTVLAGRKIAVSAAAGLNHKLGARQAGRILGRDLRPMHHAPFRHYYIARNRMLVWRRYALGVPHWAVFDLVFAGYNAFRVLVFESPKWAKLKAMALGARDGCLGRSGPCPEHR